MKKLFTIGAIGLCMLSCHVLAAEEKMTPANKNSSTAMEDKKPKGAQQEKMKRCNAEAKGLKGDERKMKMSACLKG